MKTIFLNKAIISYVQFVRRVVDGGKAKDKNALSEYREFLRSYRFCKQDKELKDTVNSLSIAMNEALVKIYYFDIHRVWAFVQLLVEEFSKKDTFVHFMSFAEDDFILLEKALRKCWFYNSRIYTVEFAYLEDEENKIPDEVKRSNSRYSLEHSGENWKELKKQAKTLSEYWKLSWKEIGKFEREEA